MSPTTTAHFYEVLITGGYFRRQSTGLVVKAVVGVTATLASGSMRLFDGEGANVGEARSSVTKSLLLAARWPIPPAAY